MTKYARYMGFAAFAINIAVFLICKVIIQESSFYNDQFTLSDYGNDPRTALVFNVSMILTSVLFFIFIRYVLTKFKFRSASLASLILIFSILGISIVGFFPYGLSNNMHMVGAVSFFIGFPIGMIIFGLKLRKTHRSKALLSIALGVLSLLGLIVFWLYLRPLALAELWSIIMPLLWVITMG